MKEGIKVDKVKPPKDEDEGEGEIKAKEVLGALELVVRQARKVGKR